MPILENGTIEYEMPKNIKEKITPEFCKRLLVELCAVFGSDAEHREFVESVDVTCGWNSALKATCQKMGCEDLYAYYDDLEWYDSDLFAEEVTAIIVAQGLLREGEFVDEGGD